MDHIRNSVTAPSTSLYNVNDMTPETVMSELNLFRPATTQWDLTSSHVDSFTNSNPMNGSSSKSEEQQSNTTVNERNDVPYDTYSGSSNGEAVVFPVTPGTSDSAPSNGVEQLSNAEDSEDSMPPRKKRTPVPNDKKDAKYWDRRKKNNEAAKRSRDLRRKKMDDELKSAKEAMQENQKLKQEIDVLKAEINSLRRLLKDANMTLSLWIRARQASEPASQLPPMLRGSNVSFVNFPVSTAI